LIEKALYGEEEWYHLKKMLKHIAEEKLSDIGSEMPFSIQKAIK